MILLRRGRQSPPSGLHIESDVQFEFGSVNRRRQECFAPWRPPLEVFETEHGLVVRAEIGGLAIEEVLVQVEGERVVIRGDRSNSKPSDQRVYHESRVRYGPFEASVRLPFPVDIPMATADYVDGFLTVRLPRLPATKVTTRSSDQDEIAQRGGQ